jgi:hypothetical protein
LEASFLESLNFRCRCLGGGCIADAKVGTFIS